MIYKNYIYIYIINKDNINQLIIKAKYIYLLFIHNSQKRIIIIMSTTEINQLKPFIYHSTEIEPVNPMFAFYLKTYAIEKANVMYKKYKDAG